MTTIKLEDRVAQGKLWCLCLPFCNFLSSH